MGYAKNKGRSSGNFIMLRHDIVRSEAWRSLSANARCVWIEIMMRFWRDKTGDKNNNSEIPLGCREAGELCNISKNTAWKAFKELQEKGFIRIGTGSAFRLKTRYSTRWVITHETLNGQTPTNEWRQWRSKN